MSVGMESSSSNMLLHSIVPCLFFGPGLGFPGTVFHSLFGFEGEGDGII